MWAWIKKWWWAFVGVLVAGLALAARFLPGRRNEQLVKQTKAEANKIKTETDLEIERHDKKIEQLQEKIDQAMGIKDKEERLQTLADLACGKRRS